MPDAAAFVHRRAKLLKHILQTIGNRQHRAGIQRLTHPLDLRMGKCGAVAAGKGILGADAKARLDNEDRTVGHGRKRGKIFADPLCALGPSAQAEGDVRAAADGNLLELLQRKTDLGQMTKGSQHSGSVGTAAAQTAIIGMRLTR